MPRFNTTVLDLLVSVALEPDCHVSSVLPEASEKIKVNLGSPIRGFARITAVNEHIVTDRIHIRELLVEMNPDETISVEVSHGRAEKKRLSVSCNGVESKLPDDDEASQSVRQLMDEDDDGGAGLPVAGSELIDNIGSPARSAPSSPHEVGLSVSPGLEITTPDDGFGTASTSVQQWNGAGLKMASFSLLGRSEQHPFNQALLSSNPSPAAMSVSIETKIESAAKDAPKGGIIVCLCVDINPIGEIELLAKKNSLTLTVMDLGLKLRLRPVTEYIQKFVTCMKDGGWFVVTRANKSIAQLRTLEGLVKEIRDNDMKDIHNNARIIICTEPHPHFPQGLLAGSHLLRISQSFNNSKLMAASSISATSTNRCLLAQSSGEPEGGPGRKVRIAASVDIVNIEPRQITTPKQKKHQPIDVSGSVVVRSVFDGPGDDKFLAVTMAGQADRFAVGSSLGNVYFFDDFGASLMQMHAHEASIWDLSFATPHRFVTGCEDGHCSEWIVQAGDDDVTLVTRYDIGGDVYAVKYLREGDAASPLIAGGLPKRLFVKTATSAAVNIALPSNCQVLTAFPGSNLCGVGGGDGSIAIIDVEKQAILLTCSEHQRKTPALTAMDTNAFFSGSFDSTIKAWDYRDNKARATHTLKLQSFVTGMHVDGFTLGACVGENLYLWDVRSLHQVLAGVPSGWKGLSRAVRICATSKTIVSASPDGHVRFWGYV